MTAPRRMTHRIAVRLCGGPYDGRVVYVNEGTPHVDMPSVDRFTLGAVRYRAVAYVNAAGRKHWRYEWDTAA